MRWRELQLHVVRNHGFRAYAWGMPVFRTAQRGMNPENRPEWSDVTAAGLFRIPTEGGRFDSHFHDCDEYWLIFEGRAKVRTEGREFYVQRGDIVCTRAGDEHDVLEVYETVEAFYFEGAMPAGGRVGHLHRDAAAAAGHDVPAIPLPNDFPDGGRS